MRWETPDGREKGEVWVNGRGYDGDVPPRISGTRLVVYPRISRTYVWAFLTRKRFSWVDWWIALAIVYVIMRIAGWQS